MNWLFILSVATTLLTHQPAEEPEPHMCPAPATVLLVRCPSRYEITGKTTTCKTRRSIDLCATN